MNKQFKWLVRITPKDVLGEDIKAVLGQSVSALCYIIVGEIKATETKKSQFGDSTEFMGEFLAIRGNDVFRSTRAYFPKAFAASLLASLPKVKTDVGHQFGAEIHVSRSRNAVGYAFVCRALTRGTDAGSVDDRLVSLAMETGNGRVIAGQPVEDIPEESPAFLPPPPAGDNSAEPDPFDPQ